MEQAIEKLRSVPEPQQDQFARFLLNELKEDDRWAKSTAQNEGKLQAFVEKVLADDQQGPFKPVDPGSL